MGFAIYLKHGKFAAKPQTPKGASQLTNQIAEKNYCSTRVRRKGR